MPPKMKDKKASSKKDGSSRKENSVRKDASPASYCSLFDRISNHNVDLGLLIVKACLTSALVGRGKIFVVPPKSELAAFAKLSRDELATSLKNYILKGNLALKDFIDGKMIFSLNFDHGYEVSVKGGKVMLNGVELTETASLNGSAGSQGGYIYFVDKALKPTKQSRQAGGAVELGDDLDVIHIKIDLEGVEKTDGTKGIEKGVILDSLLPNTLISLKEMLRAIKSDANSQGLLPYGIIGNAIVGKREEILKNLNEELAVAKGKVSGNSFSVKLNDFMSGTDLVPIFTRSIIKEINSYIIKNIYGSQYALYPLLETSFFSYVNFVEPKYFFDVLRGPFPSTLNWVVDNGWAAIYPPMYLGGGGTSGTLYNGSWYPDASAWTKYIVDYFLSPFFLFDGRIDLVPKVEKLFITGDFLGINNIFYPMFYDTVSYVDPFLVDMFGPVYGTPGTLLTAPVSVGEFGFVNPLLTTPTLLLGGTTKEEFTKELNEMINYHTNMVNKNKMDILDEVNKILKEKNLEHENIKEGEITTWSSNNNRNGVFLKTIGKVKPEYQDIVLSMQFVARYICYSLDRSRKNIVEQNGKDFNEVCSEVLSQSILASGMEGFLERLKDFTSEEERAALDEFITAELKTRLAGLKVTQDRLLGLMNKNV